MSKFTFSACDFQLIEFLMLTTEYDNDIFKLFMEVVAKLLMSTTLFSKNLITLVSILIPPHETQSIETKDSNNRKIVVTF